MALKYQLEDLLKVREKIKDTAEAVHRINNSECGEHILKSSASFDVRQNRLRTSSIVTNPYEDSIPEDLGVRGAKYRTRSGRYSKYSPTPSIKRGKAEKLLKEHGSPPGIRVTAGGRIVPNGLSPISSPRFDAHASFKPEYSKSFGHTFAQNSVPSAIPKFANGFIVDSGFGGLYQIIDGELRAVGHENGPLQLYTPSPNTHLQAGLVPMGPFSGTQAIMPLLPQPAVPLGPCAEPLPVVAGSAFSHLPTGREVKVMEQVHAKLEQELKDLDRHEVLQRALLNQTKKADIVRTRISLVNRIDESRRSIENAKRLLEDNARLSDHQYAQYNVASPLQILNQCSIPNTGANYMGSMSQSQANRYDRAVRFGKSSTNPGNDFQPDAPDFVPQRDRYSPQSNVGLGPALQERAGNIGLGVKIGINNKHDLMTTTKTFDPTHASGSMNLDGSAHQPRRSHAIEIKKPDDELADPRPQLNPTSPSYKPSDAGTDRSFTSEGHGEVLTFLPSPSLVAQMDTLVQSPRQQDRAFSDLGVETHRSSDSSATTADFFPNDAYDHSSKKKGLVDAGSQANQPAWMPKDQQPTSADTQVTPSRSSNKSNFDEDSPSNSQFVRLPASRNHFAEKLPSEYCASPESNRNEGLVRRSAHHQDSTISVENPPRGHSNEREDPLNISHLLEEVSERAATLPTTSPRQSDGYWQGYRTGVLQNVLGDNKDEEYRIGYRDGLLRSNVAPDSAPILGYTLPNQQAIKPTGRADMRDRIPSMIKATSFPSFGGPSVSMPPVPVPPANSLATTPTKYGSTRKDHSPAMEMPLDSPTARADFMSQPNINVNSMHDRGVGALRSNSISLYNKPEFPSPLMDRYFVNQVRDFASVTNDSSFAMRMQKRRGAYDQQRYQKSATSVAQTNDHARAQFPSPYDGSAEDEKPPTSAPANATILSTRGAKDETKWKASGSPVKTKASAAVATMKQVAGMTSRKDDTKKEEQQSARMSMKKQREADPSLMSSPEKKRWRDNWAKHFRQLKKEEQEEIESYARANPPE